MKYLNTTVPEHYKCADCSAHGVKLWRLYQTFLEHQVLRCASCAGKYGNEDISSLTPEGMIESKYGFGLTDQVGGMIPAVPTEDEETYWGYTSVPQAGVEWWKNLPNS